MLLLKQFYFASGGKKVYAVKRKGCAGCPSTHHLGWVKRFDNILDRRMKAGIWNVSHALCISFIERYAEALFYGFGGNRCRTRRRESGRGV